MAGDSLSQSFSAVAGNTNPARYCRLPIGPTPPTLLSPMCRYTGACNFREQRGHRMGISGAQSSGQRLQGLVPTTDISVCRIGDLASPTEHRMPRQNDDGRHPGRSAGRHVGCA
jgi:hypothetical protein